ncbi:MAG: hAT family dimerization domain-containing protein [Nitrososphaeraceae archaeon]|nr:hAT family dimerization domain-containing protein [Nitrososphaeraceae archaeon]
MQGVDQETSSNTPRRSTIVLTHQDPSQKTIFDDMFDDVPQQQDDELTKYLNMPNVAGNIDPLSWWRDRQDELPMLAILANKYLCLSATSVPSERLFSDVGNHITPKRNRLSSNIISNLLFLKRNMDFVSIFD